MRKKASFVMAGALTAALLTSGGAAVAAHVDEVDVRKDGDAGWSFNPDPRTATPYEFNRDTFTTGAGSLYVLPIQNDGPNAGDAPNNWDKFIAAKALNVDVADFNSVDYDYYVDTADTTDTEEFYLNVYANLPGSSTYYDCRYNYVPQDGPTGAWRTMTTDEGANSVVPRGGGSAALCGTEPASMPAGSTISFIALNVGDTSAGDQDVAGYFDNVVIDLESGVTAYDFEPSSTTKDDCKKGGFADFGYKNQGECVSDVNKADKPKKDKD